MEEPKTPQDAVQIMFRSLAEAEPRWQDAAAKAWRADPEYKAIVARIDRHVLALDLEGTKDACRELWHYFMDESPRRGRGGALHE